MKMFHTKDVRITDYTNPMDILNGRVPYTYGDDSQKMLQGADLFAVLRRDALLLSVIVIVATLISMLFIRKSDKWADKKEDVLHKLLIVFLIASLVTILNVVAGFFEGLFIAK